MQRSTLPGSTRSVSKAYSCVAILFASLGLAACGGGGGGGSDNPPPAAPPPPPPSSPANTAPTVEAGADQTIQLPTNAVDLAGTGQDAEGNTITYSWTASPAEGVAFADAAAAATRVTFTNAGTYTLTLSANDGTASSTDSVVVTVLAADAPPPPTSPEISWPGAAVGTDPNHGWVAVAAPADVGMDSARLAEAATYAIEGGGAGMVVRYGKLVHQWADTGVDIKARVDLKSTTKSIGSIALALAMDQQKIALGDTAESRYPNFGKDPADPTPQNATWLSQITVQQLGTHTAGFEKSRFSTADLVNAPGTRWMYSDGGLNWLADTLTNVVQQDLNLMLRESVWRPLEITTADLLWRDVSNRPAITSGTGNPIALREFAAGVIANPNAMARIGLLFLRKGMWKDTRILSEASVSTLTTPQAATATAELVDPTGFPSANEGYGVMWWTNATGQLRDVPRDAYWAWGLGDSLIVVIPSLDLVIARVGDHPDSGTKKWRSDWDGDYQVLSPFLTPIVQSVTP